MMNILTLNLHCYAEKHIQKNQAVIADAIIEHQVDVICFQEACRNHDKSYIEDLLKRLNTRGHEYHVIFAPSNIAFDQYEEGVAIMSRLPIVDSRTTNISKTQDYNDWKTRVAIHADISFNHQIIRITSVHFGWTDNKEIFETQFDTLNQTVQNDNIHIICGDFNIHDESKEYLYVTNHMYDLWNQSSDVFSSTHENKRIDYIMSNRPLNVKQQRVLFHQQDRRVSDHHGVLMSLDLNMK